MSSEKKNSIFEYRLAPLKLIKELRSMSSHRLSKHCKEISFISYELYSFFEYSDTVDIHLFFIYPCQCLKTSAYFDEIGQISVKSPRNPLREILINI